MYKIIFNNKVIDVVTTPHFIKFLSNGQVLLTDKSSANGIVGSNNTLYSFEAVTRPNIQIVTIEAISKDEFSRLNSLLNSDEEIIANEKYLAKCKQVSLAKLSKICNNKITTGFDIKLLDGKLYHFDLTLEDQLNLLNLESQLKIGTNSVVYHAAGQSCRMFTREDMLKIIKAFREHVLYHTTYFNIVKQYINGLTDIQKIETFNYGDNVSFATDDPGIKKILKEKRRVF